MHKITDWIRRWGHGWKKPIPQWVETILDCVWEALGCLLLLACGALMVCDLWLRLSKRMMWLHGSIALLICIATVFRNYCGERLRRTLQEGFYTLNSRCQILEEENRKLKGVALEATALMGAAQHGSVISLDPLYQSLEALQHEQDLSKMN